MSNYGAILTNAGAAKLATAIALGAQLKLTQMAVGDGNGQPVAPDPAMTTIPGEKRRAAINTLFADPLAVSQLVAEQIIPEDVGGWWIRCVGLYDDSNTLIAIANVPDTYKPLLTSGAGRTQIIRMVLAVSSTSAVELKIDPSIVLATRKYVEDSISAEMAKMDHKQSVRVATTANLSLFGIHTIDGIAVVVGDRVLVKDQVNPRENGLYLVGENGWSRTMDSDTGSKLTTGARVPVECGRINGGKVFYLATTGNIVIGTTLLQFKDAGAENVRSFDSISEMRDRAIPGEKCIVGRTILYRESKSDLLLSGFSAITDCYFSDFNGIHDGVTPNDVALAEIMSLTNHVKQIVFDATKNTANLGYKFSSNLDLTTMELSSEGGGFIICPVSIGDASRIKFMTGLRVKLTSYNADFEYPKNSGLDITTANIGPACVAPNQEMSQAVNLTDGSVKVMAIDGYNTASAFTGHVVTDQMAWSVQAAHDEGFMAETAVGLVHECCFIWNGSADDGAVISTILTSDYRYLVRLSPNIRAINIVKVDRTGTYQPVFDGLTNDITNNFVVTPNGGCIVVSVRIVSSTSVEIYLNDCLFKKMDLSGLIQQVGFFVSATGTNPSNDIQLYKPMVVKNKVPKGGCPLKIACVGDSITYGVESAITWPEMLKVSAQTHLGIGGVEIANFAVGGMTWGYFATGVGSSIDYSGYDYVLIMLGTNDVQAATPLDAVGGAVDELLDKIISEGAVPIVGLFPLWTEYQFSGNGNASAKNTRLAPKYRAEIKSRATKKGVVIANPLSYVGNNTQWMHDNIHPRSEGQVAISAAFSSALGVVAGPRITTNDVIKRLVEPLYDFDPSVEHMTVANDKGVVVISGAAKRRLNNPLLATIPIGYRPLRKVLAVGSDVEGNVITLSIETDGRVLAPAGADTTISVNASWIVFNS